MKRTARTRRVTKGEHLVCGGCGERIYGLYVRDLTKQPWHKSCRRMGVTKHSMSAAPARYLGRADAPCDGCGEQIHSDGDVVTVATIPWHRECFMRR